MSSFQAPSGVVVKMSDLNPGDTGLNSLLCQDSLLDELGPVILFKSDLAYRLHIVRTKWKREEQCCE